MGPRTYRNLVLGPFKASRVTVQETDLAIYAPSPLAAEAREAVMVQRGYVENYIRSHPGFLHALDPWPEDRFAPPIVRWMIDAGQKAGVGPMAAVAGAVAEAIGQDLLARTPEIIIENGGDIFISADKELTVGIYAGHSPLSLKIGLKLPSRPGPRALCTSSGTVGHSLSFGKADAVCVLGASCALADAAATAVANRIQSAKDIQAAIQWGRRIHGIEGLLVIVGENLGAWGQVNLVPVSLKR